MPFSVVHPAASERWLEGVNATIEWTSPILYIDAEYTFTIELYRNAELVTIIGTNLDPSLRQVSLHIPHNCGVEFAVDYVLVVSVIDDNGQVLDMAISEFFGLGGIRFSSTFIEAAPGNIMGFPMSIQSFAQYPDYSVALYTGAHDDPNSSLVYFPRIRVNITEPTYFWRVPLHLSNGIYHMRASVMYIDMTDNKTISVTGYSDTFSITDPIQLNQSSIPLIYPTESTTIYSDSIQNITIDPRNGTVEQWGIDLYSKNQSNPAYYGLQIAADLSIRNGTHYVWTVPYDLPSGQYFYYIWAWTSVREPSIVPLAVTSSNFSVVQLSIPNTGNFLF